jgi:hypothetical protein
MLLADLYYRKWQATRSPDDLNRLADAAGEAIARDPKAVTFHQRQGQCWLAIFRATGDENDRDTALRHAVRAVHLFPTSSEAHAALAWLYHVAGRRAEAQDEAAESLRLDSLNPHEDRSLEHVKFTDPSLPDDHRVPELMHKLSQGITI